MVGGVDGLFLAEPWSGMYFMYCDYIWAVASYYTEYIYSYYYIGYHYYGVLYTLLYTGDTTR